MNDLVSVDSLQSDQEQFAMSIIQSKGENLPDTIEAIIPILAFSKAKADAYNALSNAASKVKDQEALNEAALASGQRWGIVHLYGQKRLGEITREMPKAITRARSGGTEIEKPDVGSKTEQLARVRVGRYESSDAERIAAHPEIMEKVIEDAQERGDIPTKGAVLSRIKAESYKTLSEQVPKRGKDDIGDVALTISNKLGEYLIKLSEMWIYKDSIPSLYRDSIISTIASLYELTQGDYDE